MEKEVVIHQWTVWPARMQPVRATMAWLVVLAGIITAGQVSILLGIGIAMAFFISVGEILLPSRYIFTSEGTEIRSIYKMTKKKWSSYTGWRETDKGFYLIGKGSRPFIIRRRSLMVYCFAERDKIINLLTKFIAPQKNDQT